MGMPGRGAVCLPGGPVRGGHRREGRRGVVPGPTRRHKRCRPPRSPRTCPPAGPGSAATRCSCVRSAVSLSNKLATSLPATVVAAESTARCQRSCCRATRWAWPRQHRHRGDEPKGNPGRCPPRPEGTGFPRQGATKDCRRLISPRGLARRSRPAPWGTLPVCHGEGLLGSGGREGVLPAVSDRGFLTYTSYFRESG